MHKSRQSVMDVIFTLALFCVFCAAAIGVVIIGVGVYKNTAVDMENNFGTRTAIAYITEKARQSDAENAISLRQTQGKDTVVFKTKLDGYDFETTIFFEDGYIRELNALEGADVSLVAAQRIVAIKGFTVEKIDDNLYKATATGENGEVEEVVFALTSSQE